MTHTVDRGYPWQIAGSPGLELQRARSRPTEWATTFSRFVTVSDGLAVLAATVSTHLIWFGFQRVPVAAPIEFGIDYLFFSAGLMLAWMVALSVSGSRDTRILGTDSTEYRRVVNSTLLLFGSIGVFAAMTQTDLARGYLLTAFPLGLGILLASRWGWRRWLHVRRRRGEFSFRVLIIGNSESVRELATSLSQRPDAGYRVVGALVTDGTSGSIEGVPATRVTRNTLFARLGESTQDTVIVVGSDDLDAAAINELSWRLDAGQQLVVAPQLVGVAGSRIHTRPVAGLPLIHVETPSYDGAKRFAKRAFDIVSTSLLLLVLAPIFVVTAILIKLTSPGPVFYRQERIGMSGEPFHILKFRSMVVNADSRLAALLAEQGNGSTPLFKVKHDPRITPIGRIIRRYSIDELPQLFNVLAGQMSLVGPRPQVDGEVRLYDSKASRRLAVKPGMSGLWQVSGRSNLSWEDSIRLDLYYVENWSVTSDLVILMRTAKAVFAHDGAY
ncbi:MAG: sugar transferase [Salinibacterium sp.]|nr:sugar transferase [Salinibacterium sp.]